MHVVATAGHVDHGKSTLVRTLTGMEPDRWAEERRRGMTIDLGFAWTTLHSGRRLAFVDVPGHERFVPNMLAGVGPVPAAMMVVAADEGWMPQSGEHLAALHALDVRHGLLVVTRSDLADAELLEAATAEAQAALEGTSLAGIATVAVSGTTGAGLHELKRALDSLLAQLPEPDVDAPVRLWVDRCFTVTGSGSVVTGTLAAGRVRVGDELVIASRGQRVTVRGLQSLGETITDVPAVARVALNLRGVARSTLRRGEALLTPGNFVTTDTVDVRLHGDAAAELPRTLVLHAGSAAVPVRVRPLGDDTARLSLARALPLRLGDRALLRDAGRHHVAGGLTMLDVRPPRLQGRGSATARAAVLATVAGNPDEVSEVRRRRLVRRADLAAMGVPVSREPIARDWLADPAYWAELRQRLDELVARHKEQHPLEDGPPVEAVRQRLGLPDVALVEALVVASQKDDLAGPGQTAAPPPLALRGGRIVRAGAAVGLPPAVQAAMERLREDLAAAPFAAPDAARLVELGLGSREIAAAARAGVLLRVTDTVVLLPGAAEVAAGKLRDLEQPFTLSEARRALATTRRVAVPLLEFLDRQGWTRRLPDDRRTMR